MNCFKCDLKPGVARRSHAMHKGWYETPNPSRTIHLCDDCYVPDKLAGRRTSTFWEQDEAIWGELRTVDSTGEALWQRYQDGDHDAVYQVLFAHPPR